MKDRIKAAVIHARAAEMPGDAAPRGEGFTEAAAIRYIEANVAKALGFMHEAGRAGCDIVCTNECYTRAGQYVSTRHPDRLARLIERTRDGVADSMSAVAKRYGMHVAENRHDLIGGRVYNTSYLYGRDGSLTGRYQKVHLPDGERRYAEAGQEFPVFDTDIGRIGFAVCYDIIFPETFRILALNGADIIIHQTVGWGKDGRSSYETGEAFMRVRAAENSVYFLVAKNLIRDGGRSCILDNDGNIIAIAPGTDECLVTAEFAPNFDLIDPYDYGNYFADVPGTKIKQMLARRPELYGALTQRDTALSRRYRAQEYSLCATRARHDQLADAAEAMDAETRAKYFHYIFNRNRFDTYRE